MAIMRLKKGTKVEVWSKREESLGSWRLAEIISGNGRTYQVKYESDQPGIAAATERVARKFIRPLPPSMVGSANWTPGDIVEALENHSWRTARVSSVAAGDYYFVRIIGSCKHIIAHKSELRVQQSWEDNHWVISQKGSSRFKDAKVRRRSNATKDFNHHTPPTTGKVKAYEVDGQIPLKEHHGLKAGLRKRGSVCLPVVEPCMHASMNHRELGSADAQQGNDTHSISSSVGSSSPCSRVYHLTTSPTQDKSPDHHLELHAYHCTMMALHSSDHVTWEQEAFLTDLRLQLHISNDEHLAELKHFTSSKNDRDSYT